jgi:MFS family permease
MYAATAVPLSESRSNVSSTNLLTLSTAWDQGSASTVASLAGFQDHFGVSSGSDAGAVRNIVSLVYLGDAAGAALSFFINDRIGRLWSFRLYSAVWIIGQLVAMFSPGLAGLYAARIISGLGIGALGVTGPISIVEIAPTEIRGLLTAWYSVSMAVGLMVSTFCVYGVQLHIEPSRLQYQVVWFAPCVFIFLWVVASFFLCESPRWLIMSDQHEKAVESLVRLRCLQADHPLVHEEIQSITESIRSENETSEFDQGSSFKIVGCIKETFTVPSNLRRVQQALILYAFPQLSGGNSITNYFIPILQVLDLAGSSTRNLFLNGMYALSKFFFAIFTSFFFIDALGRRNSLFLGISIQMISDLYLGIYLKFQQENGASHAAGEAALASIFLHAFGYTIG